MGNSASTQVARVAPLPETYPTATPKPCRRVLYKLPFRFTMNCSVGTPSLEEEDIQDAIGLLYYEGIWFSYLQQAMEDSWLEFINRDVDPESEHGVIRKEIEPLHTKWGSVIILKTETAGSYTGSVWWKSRVVPLEILQRNLEWRIGCQMGHYEVQDPSGRWYGTIEIGDVEVDVAS